MSNLGQVIAELKDTIAQLQKATRSVNFKSRYSLTIKQAIEYLGLGDDKIRQLLDDGVIPYSKPGRDILIKREDLEKFVDDNAIRIPKQ